VVVKFKGRERKEGRQEERGVGNGGMGRDGKIGQGRVGNM